MRRALIAAGLTSALLLGACGGGDDGEKQAQQVVRDFAKAISESDGKTFCQKLVTHEFLEQTTQAKGKNAEDQCERQINALKGQTYRVVKITKTEINGDKATVTAELEAQGQKRPQVFRLQKEDGDFRLTAARTQ